MTECFALLRETSLSSNKAMYVEIQAGIHPSASQSGIIVLCRSRGLLGLLAS